MIADDPNYTYCFSFPMVDTYYYKVESTYYLVAGLLLSIGSYIVTGTSISIFWFTVITVLP